MGNGDLNAWLVRKSGLLAGTRHMIREEVTRIGRSSENDVVIAEAAMVSARHAEILKVGDACRLRDLSSTNGTYLNGEKVSEGALESPCTIRLGADGPEFAFVIDDSPAEDLNATLLNTTLVAPPAPPEPLPEKESPDAGVVHAHEELLSEAVARARKARRAGFGDSTVVIMREMLNTALHRTGRKFKTAIGMLVFALVAISGYGYWKIDALKKDKSKLDGEMQQIEATIAQSAYGPAETDQLIDLLDQYEGKARALQNTLLYRVSSVGPEESLKREIRALMAEFGAETYSIPPEFLDEVKRFIERYQQDDRAHMERALGEARKDMDKMRGIFEQNQLPPDLAYVVLVESAFSGASSSPAGALGLWQFTPVTARAYGLKVTEKVDERLDAVKSTRAACKYMRELILDFGSGSSVMLALAAYNLGPARVKAAVRKVQDPIKQRNFWYLYRVRAVPPETREYVPKVIAAMLIARRPEQYGF